MSATLEGGFGVIVDPDRFAKIDARIAERWAEGSHVLAVSVDHGDGFVDSWSSVQPGVASDAFKARVKRLREARREFTQDKAALSVTFSEMSGAVTTVRYSPAENPTTPPGATS